MNIHRSDGGGGKSRLFFALWPSPILRDGLYAEALACGKQHGGRGMQRDTLHMTLLFLGDVPHDRITELTRQVDQVECEHFVVRLDTLKCWQHNHIAFASPGEDIPGLRALAAQLRQAAKEADVAFDGRAFTPHVTLVRKLATSFETVPLELPVWRVSGFSLVESVLHAEGARYRNLQTWSCC